MATQSRAWLNALKSTGSGGRRYAEGTLEVHSVVVGDGYGGSHDDMFWRESAPLSRHHKAS